MSNQTHDTSTICAGAVLGDGVTIGPYTVVHPNVTVGDGAFVDSYCILGAPTAEYYADPRTYERERCTIGSRAVIRSHCVVYAGVRIGDDFECGHHVTIREGTRIDDGVRIGTLCDIQPDVIVGRYARLHSSVFVARGSTIEELTWLFPYALLIDDPHPPSDSCLAGPTVRRFAVVGARSMVFPGVEIGEGAVVGAMSLVRHDVSPHTVVVGVPASVVARTSDVVCHEGRLDRVYPWWKQFRGGYPGGVLPDPEELS